MHVRAFEFYSGIGGLHRALNQCNISATVVRAFDWDQTSCRVYNANYGSGIVEKTDISTLDASDLFELDAALWLLSPSCQPYTVLNPNAKGAADPRARSFLHLVEHVVPDLVKVGCGPKWLLVENVAGFETSTTRQTLVDVLERNNYAVVELLLTPLQFGIPNSRLRYYLLAKARPMSFSSASTDNQQPRQIWRHIPGYSDLWADTRDGCGAAQLKMYLDPDLQSDEDHPYKVPDRVLEKWGRLFDIVLPTSRRSCCFTRGYTRMVERTGSILQMNEELNTTRTFDEFLSLQKLPNTNTTELQVQTSSGPFHLVSTLRPLRLRYFSPSELLRLFHFDAPEISKTASIGKYDRTPSFVWPVGVSEKSKYRLLGNSVNVEVVRRLINYLFEGEEDSDACAVATI